LTAKRKVKKTPLVANVKDLGRRLRPQSFDHQPAVLIIGCSNRRRKEISPSSTTEVITQYATLTPVGDTCGYLPGQDKFKPANEAAQLPIS
jgi:hypothetical protein